MFELSQPTTVTLDNFQTRMQHHGDQLVPAVDLSLTWKTHNSALDALVPGLREMLFEKAEPEPEAEQAEMDLPVDELGVIRFALKYPLRPLLDLHGMRLVVEYGLGGDRSDIVLSQCHVGKFEVTPINGGSVELAFKVSSAKDIDEDVTGRLPLMQQQDIVVRLTAPEVQADTTAPLADLPEAEPDLLATSLASAQALQGKVEAAFLGTAKP
jgi:hypothetical protein